MTLDRENDHSNNSAGAWATIGSFDGVHLGHQSIIRSLVEGSRQAGKPSIVVTFFPHPIKVLRDNPGPYYLTSPEEKNRYIQSFGVDSVLTLNFSRSLSLQSSDAFIRTLHNHVPFSCLLIGYDFRLGANRDGNIETLGVLGKELGYCVRAVEPFLNTDQPVSSSRIRELIQNGNIGAANELLGRPYSANGRITRCDSSNLQKEWRSATLEIWSEKLLPGSGAYAAFAVVDGRTCKALVNIGTTETAQGASRIVEADLLDVDGEIHDPHIEIKFAQHLHSERKFTNSDELMVQINQDIQFTREVLDNEPSQTNLSA